MEKKENGAVGATPKANIENQRIDATRSSNERKHSLEIPPKKSPLNIVQTREPSGFGFGDRPPLIEPGLYNLEYLDRNFDTLHGRAKKMRARFRITTFGPHLGTVLICYWNLKSYNNKKGTFKVGWKSRFVREYAKLFGLPRHQKEFSMAPFKGIEIVGKVKTVTHDSKQRPLPEDCHYTVIEELIKRENT